MNTTLKADASSGIRRPYLRWPVVVILLLTAAAPGAHAQQTSSKDMPRASSKIECQRVVIFGAVHQPGRFEFRQPLRLLEALAIAGGPTVEAGQTVQIIHTACGGQRPGEQASSDQTYQLNSVLRGVENANPFLQAGDIVIVAESPVAFVLGSVWTPLTIHLKTRITVTRAIALAGGVLRESKTDRIRIIRQQTGGGPATQIFIDLEAIKKHRASDVVLQPNDIVEVPGSQPGRDRLLPPRYDVPTRPSYDSPTKPSPKKSPWGVIA
jgi:protein involved in polysaccharide export with SLBB domain